jgi:hypothetical protein
MNWHGCVANSTRDRVARFVAATTSIGNIPRTFVEHAPYLAARAQTMQHRIGSMRLQEWEKYTIARTSIAGIAIRATR